MWSTRGVFLGIVLLCVVLLLQSTIQTKNMLLGLGQAAIDGKEASSSSLQPSVWDMLEAMSFEGRNRTIIVGDALNTACFSPQCDFEPVLWHMVDPKYKVDGPRMLAEKREAEQNGQRPPKYFFYQPSGGFGNQRYDLMWAMIAANAMERTLIVPPIGPHTSMYWNYNRVPRNELLPMAQVLNMEALSRAVKHGVLSFNDTVLRLRQYLPSQLSFNTYVRPESVQWLSHRRIRQMWIGVKEDVVFWSKASMWCCCGTSKSYKDYYARHVMFNNHFKSLARRLIYQRVKNGTYNAVHVRRGDHVQKDRASALSYFQQHHLEKFNKSVPLYVATDEKDRSFFDDWLKRKPAFKELIFWQDLNQEEIQSELQQYPKRMTGDVLGFLEMLICAFARRWEGSKGSTFSSAIQRTRAYRELRWINFTWPEKPQ